MLDTFRQDNNVNNIDMQGTNPDNLPPLLEVSDDEYKLEDDDEEITNIVAQLEKSWETLQEGAPGQDAEDDQKHQQF